MAKKAVSGKKKQSSASKKSRTPAKSARTPAKKASSNAKKARTPAKKASSNTKRVTNNAVTQNARGGQRDFSNRIRRKVCGICYSNLHHVLTAYPLIFPSKSQRASQPFAPVQRKTCPFTRRQFRSAFSSRIISSALSGSSVTASKLLL